MRLVLCDDNRILCEALASVLEARGDQVLAVATGAAECIAAVCAQRPDVCLLDLCLPDGDGLDAARKIRRSQPDTKIVVLSCRTDPATVTEAKQIGVAGFVRKDQTSDAITAALDVVAGGGLAFGPDARAPRTRDRPATGCRGQLFSALTARETEVLQRIVAGQSTRQMASEMNVSVSTLRGYVKSILAKLGAHSRLEAAAIASSDRYLFVA
jgi:two-component system, NarL family, nitrate/nitrite response regulator NarL